MILGRSSKQARKFLPWRGTSCSWEDTFLPASGHEDAGDELAGLPQLPHLVTGRTQQCRIPDLGSFTHYGGFHNRNDWQKNASKMQILATKRSPLRGTLSKHHWLGSWAPLGDPSMQAPRSTLQFYLHYPCLPNTHMHHTHSTRHTHTPHTHHTPHAHTPQ